MNIQEVKKFKRKIYSFLIIVNLILLVCTYLVMPTIQNYPPNSEVIEFQKSVEALSHLEQYGLIFLIGTLLHIFALSKMMKNVFGFLNKFYKKEKIDENELKKVRKDCLNIPYKFYVVQMIIVLMLGIGLTLLLISDGLAILKFFLMLFSVISLIDIIQFMFIQKQLKSVILLTYKIDSQNTKVDGYRVKFSTSLMIQIIPFLAVSIIIISLVGYAKATTEKGTANANYYKAYLDSMDINIDTTNLIEKLNSIPLNNEKEDYYFIIGPNMKTMYISKPNKEVTDFAKKYIDYFFKGTSCIVYEFYGTEQQAYTIKLTDKNGEDWYIGFEYYTRDNSLMTYYIVIMIGILILYGIILYFWAKNISNNIIDVSDSLKKIAKQKRSDKENIVPIVSNDEIGDLAYSYNKIEELTNKHLKEIEDNQYVMERQAQFSILGEFAGGLAHDLNSPLSAVKMDIGTLKLYVNSDKITADDKVKNTLNEMFENINESLNSMGETITGVRNQIRATGDTEKEEFLLKDVLEGIKIVFRSLFMKHNCQLEVDIPNDLKIYGEKNKLDRVLGNIIKNSLDAYESINKKGNIKIKAIQAKKKVEIQISDEAGGIPEQVKNTIFKEMKTTKKDSGTGFGLYYSNTIIEGSFKGKMSYETKDGIGTTFIIEIPNREEKKDG